MKKFDKEQAEFIKVLILKMRRTCRTKERIYRNGVGYYGTKKFTKIGDISEVTKSLWQEFYNNCEN